MTGGGILALVAYGAQNVLLSGNPQMTYFYKAFKRHTHFSIESITVPLEGPNELSYEQPIHLRAKIPRHGDLLSDLYFTFQIPDIYSKYLPPQPPPGRICQWEFEWSRYLGAAIIRNASFFVGGQKIQEVDGSYLLSKALLDYDQDTFAKWKYLVGDTSELTAPSLGAYAGGTTHAGYPTVITDPTLPPSTPQTNRPSILGREIVVPLSFWFSESFSKALPLIGLQYQECEIQMDLNPINQLYTVLDASGYRVNPDFVMRASDAEIGANNPSYAAASDNATQIRNFFTDIGATVPPLNNFFINPRLQGTYVYLPKEEQTIFASNPLSYVMRQVTAYPFQGLITKQVLDLYTHNPITRLIFAQRRSDATQRNDFANFTNWFTYPFAPFFPTPGVLKSLQATGVSGLLIPNTQQGIIRGLRVFANGNEIQEPKPADFFGHMMPFRYSKGVGQEGLLLYSFELNNNPDQPAGSVNSSRIRNFQVEVDVFPLPAVPNYTYDLTIYVENINWFEVSSGTGGLKYAL